MTNLRQKATHSTQTGLSHFKRNTDTQVRLICAITECLITLASCYANDLNAG